MAESVRIVAMGDLIFLKSQTFTVRSSLPETTLSPTVNTAEVTVLQVKGTGSENLRKFWGTDTSPLHPWNEHMVPLPETLVRWAGRRLEMRKLTVVSANCSSCLKLSVSVSVSTSNFSAD